MCAQCMLELLCGNEAPLTPGPSINPDGISMRVKNTEASSHQMVKVPMSSTVRPVSPPAWLVSEMVTLEPVYREVILPLFVPDL